MHIVYIERERERESRRFFAGSFHTNHLSHGLFQIAAAKRFDAFWVLCADARSEHKMQPCVAFASGLGVVAARAGNSDQRALPWNRLLPCSCKGRISVSLDLSRSDVDCGQLLKRAGSTVL